MTRLPSSRAEHRTGESMIGLNGTFAPPLLAHARFAGRNGLCLSDGMSSASDPNVWSGRALQEDFSEFEGCGGLASMYPAFDWSLCAPGHHGYQRACDLISG